MKIDDRVWVSLGRCCEYLGVLPEIQLRKRKKTCWATTVETTLVAADGKMRSMTMIDLASLPMRLATINIGKMST